MDSKYCLYEFFKRNEPQISNFILNKEKELITEEENDYFKNNSQPSTKDSDNYKNINQSSTKDPDNNNQKNVKKKKKKKKKSLNYYMKQLSNGFFVKGGARYLFFYDSSFNFIEKIEIDNNDIYENINCDNNSNIEIYVFSKNKISIIYINQNGEISDIKKEITDIKEIGGFLFFKGETLFYICNDQGLYALNKKSFDQIKFKLCYEIKATFNGGIQINNCIISLTSNKNKPNEEEEIIFYNIYSEKKKSETIGEYSFVTSHNNLALLPKSDENNKYLICACKKKENQVNSLLLIKLELEKNDVIKKFYDEANDNFEVYCFCPLSFVKNKKEIINAKNNVIKNTDFFLVGGFDKNNGKGLIKLYKLISNNEGISIQFIKNVDDFSKDNNMSVQTNNKIICIIQSKTDGKIIITFDNGESTSFQFDMLHLDQIEVF